MSAHSGPNNSENGLVFYYDMGNAKKSWKGKPTVNLIANAGADAEIERSGTTYPYFSANITSYVLANWSASNNKLSMSFEGKRNYSAGGTGSGGDGYPSMYIYFTDWTWSSSFGITTYDWSYNALNNITMPDPTGKTIYFSIYHMNSGNPGLSYSRKHQVEFGTFATPFVNGPRTNTQAVVDLSSNRTATVSSLTYNSNGSLSFSGSDSFSIPSIDFSSEQTIEIWLQPTENDGTRRNPYNQAYGGYGTWTHEPSGVFNYYYGDAGANNTPYIGHTSSFTVNQNEIACVCTTRNVSESVWYKNGIRDNSYTHGYGTLTADSNPIIIGSGYAGGYVGNIFAVKLYNRALSADEVRDNFNALRGRFGI